MINAESWSHLSCLAQGRTSGAAIIDLTAASPFHTTAIRGRLILGDAGAQDVPPEDGSMKNGGSPASRPNDAATIRVRNHDWEPVLRELTGLLREILKTELVQADREARRIIHDMVHCKDMAEIDAQMDVLIERMNELLAAKSGDPNAAPRIKTGMRGRTSLRTISSPHTAIADEPDIQPGRTFLRL
jgi:hypothetical protein